MSSMLDAPEATSGLRESKRPCEILEELSGVGPRFSCDTGKTSSQFRDVCASCGAYLEPLFPVEFPVTGISGPFTVVVEPTPTWLAVLGLLVFTVVIVTLTAIGIRHTEVEYGGD
jgi:hypothetical protein